MEYWEAFHVIDQNGEASVTPNIDRWANSANRGLPGSVRESGWAAFYYGLTNRNILGLGFAKNTVPMAGKTVYSMYFSEAKRFLMQFALAVFPLWPGPVRSIEWDTNTDPSWKGFHYDDPGFWPGF